MSKFDTKEFKELQNKWYDILEKEGFLDIERNSKEAGLRKEQFDGRDKYGWKSKEAHKSKINYYQLATRFLNDYSFDKEIDKIIWEYHSNGISHRNIAKILTDTKVMKTNRETIGIKIRELKEKMKEFHLK